MCFMLSSCLINVMLSLTNFGLVWCFVSLVSSIISHIVCAMSCIALEMIAVCLCHAFIFLSSIALTSTCI